MSRALALPGLAAEGYSRHPLHAEDRLWVEKNCYVDIVIELLHALGVEPVAALGFCAAIDFEGDNFTFFKPQHDELREFFGVDFQELNVWRPLIEHAQEHLRAGKFISTEADSFWLPDTAGTDYRRNHVKTTIILADVDVDARQLGYFHNASYHALEGEDFERLFRIGAPPDPTFLPLFAELIRVDRMVRRPLGDLARRALSRLGRHVAARPRENPVQRFGARFADELPRMRDAGLAFYHAWAFATTRQLGASTELLAAHLRWLAETGAAPQLTAGAAEFATLSALAKTFILKAARAVNSRKTVDLGPLLDEMAGAWQRGIDELVRHVPDQQPTWDA